MYDLTREIFNFVVVFKCTTLYHQKSKPYFPLEFEPVEQWFSFSARADRGISEDKREKSVFRSVISIIRVSSKTRTGFKKCITLIIILHFHGFFW